MNTLTATQTTNSESFMNLLSTALLLLCFVFQTTIAAVDWYYVGVIVGSCFSGAIILSYVRREKSIKEICFKALASMVAGIVFGGAIVKWLKVVELEFIVFSYFLSSIISLILINAALSETEENAPRLVIGFFQRIFNYKPRQTRRVNRRREKSIEQSQDKEQ